MEKLFYEGKEFKNLFAKCVKQQKEFNIFDLTEEDWTQVFEQILPANSFVINQVFCHCDYFGEFEQKGAPLVKVTAEMYNKGQKSTNNILGIKMLVFSCFNCFGLSNFDKSNAEQYTLGWQQFMQKRFGNAYLKELKNKTAGLKF